ncbi:MAG: antibiotic biosynthesis monooxygenase [Syntrophomonadaceae bacterium]|jgi:quinol monooxygenase YgiN|nr:antibiotic biosynthesis monooxygenase [Syntrophomonadaceae bacterium]
MLLVTAKLKVKEGKQKEFIGQTKDLLENTRKEEGNISYNLFNETDDETRFIFVEEWESDEALKAHTKAPHFAVFGTILKEIGDGKADIKVYTVSSVR